MNYRERKVVALAGPAVKESARKYYRVPLGASLEGALADNFEGEEIRLINGNIMWGDQVKLDTCGHFYGSEYFAIEEDRSPSAWLDDARSYVSIARIE